MPHRRFLVLLPFTLLILMLGSATTLGQETPPETAEHRLARQWVRAARTSLLVDDPVHIETVEAARMLLYEVLALERQDPEWWRLALSLATFADDEDLIDDALVALSGLDPTDDTVTLRRLMRSIDQLGTVSERVARYRRLLEEADRGRLSKPIASRLALDLALLHRRHGDLEAFADMLAKAVSLDSSNRAAAAIATGYFRVNVADPTAEAELLLSLVRADPTDATAQAALARLFMDVGAYAAADRFYGLTTRTREALGLMPTGNLLADLALAQWAAGREAAALDTIRVRQNQMDTVARMAKQREVTGGGGSPLTPLERDEIVGALDPALTTVRAAIQTLRGEDAATEIDRTVEQYLDAIRLAEEQRPDDINKEEVASIRLECAWMTVWLGNDLDRVESLLAELEAARPLRPEARARFDGWLALRRGDIAGAIEQLEPLADADLAAAVGLVEARLTLDQTREAARTALSVARRSPGTVLGVWCVMRLNEMLGQRVPISDDARRLEQLGAALPSVIDRYPKSPSLALQLTMRPRQATYAPYDPIVVDAIITNNAPFRLGIDREGPIRPQVVFEIAGFPRWVVDIDRRLSLAPGERLVIPIDLTETIAGMQLMLAPIPGVMFSVRAILNPRAQSNGVLVPSMLGGQHETPALRIDGTRVSNEWLRRAIDLTADRERSADPESLTMLALLANVVGRDLPVNAPAEAFTLQADARNGLLGAFARLDEVGQAWLVGALSTDVLRKLGPMMDAAKRSPSRLVRISYLMRHVSSPDDPAIAEALASGDRTLVALGAFARLSMRLQSEAAQAEALDAGRSR